MKLLLVNIIFAGIASGFIAYDCAAPNANITTISLLNVKPCQIEARKPIVTDTYVRLLQLARVREIHVKTCRVHLNRIINHCGMWSHNSLVHNGVATYLIELTPEICHNMHQTLTYSYKEEQLITKLQRNGTITTTRTISGSVKSDGACTGGSFSDDFGAWDNVLVEGMFTISLYDYYASVKLDENKVILRNGRHCLLSQNECMDNDGSSVYWTSVPHTKCSFTEYDTLYEGPAQRIYDNTTTTQNIEEIYSVQTGEIIFGLTRRGSDYVCEHRIILTEHPRLFILEISSEDRGTHTRKIAVNNLDLLSYMNSKFVHIEKHFGKQLKDLYMDILSQKCELERQVIENSLLIAENQPAEFALRIMRQHGYMANIAGEVIHIIKCVPVPVKIARLNNCYSDLPVILHDNETMFITPNTHILMKRSSQIACNSYLPPMYKVDNTWVRLSPEPHPAVTPQELEPTTKPTWNYENLKNLATSGIYSQEDLMKLQDHLMFAEEQTSILESLARGSLGQEISSPGISLSHLLDEKSVERIAERATTKLWGWLTGFGTVSAGLIGIFVILKAIKFIVDTLVHGYALHKAFGWSIWLLGAFCDSISNFLLHFKRTPADGIDEEKANIKISQKEEQEKKAPKETAPVSDHDEFVYPDLRMSQHVPRFYPRL